MEKRTIKILPYFEERIWGGSRLLERYGYETDVFPAGEVYNVVALPGAADCPVDGMDMTLSQLYDTCPEWFDCETEQLPIRVNILDPLHDLSVQLHPDDGYALAHDSSRGKPECWVILDAPEDGKIEYGHNARSKEEFSRMATDHDWGHLLKYLPAKKGWFIDIPAGTLHAIGRDVLTYNVSRNADLTYRLFDYDRIDPKIHEHRELAVDKVIDCVNVPDATKGFVWFGPRQEGDLEVTDYWDEPGLYTLSRVKCCGQGSYALPRFAFYTVVEGAGLVNDVPVKKGETVLVPAGTGEMRLAGVLDGFVASYRNETDTRGKE